MVDESVICILFSNTGDVERDYVVNSKLIFDILCHSLSPSNQQPCHSNFPEWRYVTFRLKLWRHANAFHLAQTKLYHQDEFLQQHHLHVAPNRNPMSRSRFVQADVCAMLFLRLVQM